MINERSLTPAELNKREDIIMNMKGNKRDLVKKYGKDAEAVMYGRATNMAKKQTENMRDSKLTELIKDALANPKKADLDKDGKLSSYEKTRGAAIEKNISEDDDLESGAYGDPVDAELDVTKAAPDQTGLEAELGLEEDINETLDDDVWRKLKDLRDGYEDDYILKSTIKLMSTDDANLYLDTLMQNHGFGDGGGPIEPIDEDLEHEDNEPGMLQGDLYQIGKSAMELYELLDDMEGEGEVDLPSWWQAKIYKAKEAIVGAAEYLEFELKEPAIDAVVDTLAPLDIEVDPLGETVEDYITSVDDMTESQKAAEKIFKKLKEGLPKDYWDKKIDAKDENQDGKVDESVTNQDIEDIENSGNIDIAYKKALNMLKKLVKDENQDGKVDESYATVVNKIEKSGKSEKAAKAIAGAVASYKAKGGGKGPTAKQK